MDFMERKVKLLKRISIPAGLFVSYMSKRIEGFGFMPTMLLAIPLHSCAYLGVLLTFPSDANFHPTTSTTVFVPRLNFLHSLTIYF